MLNDYKDTDFIGIVTVSSKTQNQYNPDVDDITLTTQEIFKGEALDKVLIFQKKGNGKNNDNCRLYLNSGDQLLLYANKKADYFYTMPCYRNKLLTNTEADYQVSIQNQLKILRQLQPFQEELAASATRCSNSRSDLSARTSIENIRLSREESRMGLYSVKFTTDHKIDRVEVVSPYSDEVDNKVRIALIKKNWKPCKLTDNRTLILGYFYTPATSHRRAHLSSL